ncbi:MAG: sigma-70 family RNA polymerase sigma factor [Ruminiclostridium sp.]|nr:sigma-70 family RNA polymerase sigma factor [Ruminiclostridium sp.]
MLSLYLSMVETEEQRSLVEQLYCEYEQVMYRTAFNVLHNTQDAEDAVHEAFMRIITGLEKVNGIEPAKRGSYVIIVTKNIAIDLYRRNRKQVDTDALSGDIPDTKHDVEREVFGKYGCEELNSALSRLSDTQREVLIMRYFHNDSTEDIADALGISPEAVRVRLHRARNALYGLLKDDVNDDI